MKSRNDVCRGMIGRLLSDELTLLNNEPRRLSNPVTAASWSLSRETFRRVMSERIERGSIEVISGPTTERNRTRASWSVKYHPRASLYNLSNGSSPLRFVLGPRRYLIHDSSS